jgi:hypothetical protein
MFVTRPDGSVCLRDERVEPYEVRDDISMVAGCYELTATKAAWRIRVDSDLLRGSGRHMPEQLAGWFGLRPGMTKTLGNHLHPLPVSWRPWSPPDVGSLKSFADELGAGLGDWLILIFDQPDTVSCRLVDVEYGDRLARLAAMIGLEVGPAEERATLLAQLAAAFKVDAQDTESLPFRVRMAIERRGDVDIAELAEQALLG